MTGYLILIGIFLFIAFVFWLRQPVKKTVVYPVDLTTGKLKDALLSEKRRVTVIREKHGIVIGFWLAMALVGALYCGLGGGN